MTTHHRQPGPVSGALLVIVLFTICESAEAFRCKSRVIRDGMHEAEVVRLCGEPVAIRDLGYVVRSYGYQRRSPGSLNRPFRSGYGHYQREVRVTEMLFNFGPRKLMRQVVFEGGILRSIRTMGYGYHEKR